jgi:hypothetical protein
LVDARDLHRTRSSMCVATAPASFGSGAAAPAAPGFSTPMPLVGAAPSAAASVAPAPISSLLRKHMSEWSEAEVGEWLQSIGALYGQYRAAFAANALNGRAVVRLGAEELKELGVASGVHRARLMADISYYSAARPKLEPAAQVTASGNVCAFSPFDPVRSPDPFLFRVW